MFKKNGLPKALAIATLSRTAISGTEMMLAPIEFVMSPNVYRVLFFMVLNGGGWNGGIPPVIEPVEFSSLKNF